MSAPEFSRPVKARHLPAGPLVLEANAEERVALAKRFGVGAIDALRAEVMLAPDKDAVVASGTLAADIVQTCAVAGEDFPTRIEEPLSLRFVPVAEIASKDEIEVDTGEFDEVEFVGEFFDLAEAVAQTLGLAIDPYATGPDADKARKEKGLQGDDETSGPLAELLAGFRKG